MLMATDPATNHSGWRRGWIPTRAPKEFHGEQRFALLDPNGEVVAFGRGDRTIAAFSLVRLSYLGEGCIADIEASLPDRPDHRSPTAGH